MYHDGGNHSRALGLLNAGIIFLSNKLYLNNVRRNSQAVAGESSRSPGLSAVIEPFFPHLNSRDLWGDVHQLLVSYLKMAHSSKQTGLGSIWAVLLKQTETAAARRSPSRADRRDSTGEPRVNACAVCQRSNLLT